MTEGNGTDFESDWTCKNGAPNRHLCLMVDSLTTAVLIIETVVGISAKCLITWRVFCLRNITPASIYLIDKGVGDTLFLVTWILSEIFGISGVFPNDIVLAGLHPGRLANGLYITLDSVNTICFVHSVTILTFLSVQRCRIVLKPFLIYGEVRSAALKRLCLIWLFSICLGGYIEFNYVYLMSRYAEVQYIFQTLITTITYIIPLLIIGGSYMLMSHRLTRTFNLNVCTNDQKTGMDSRKALAQKLMILVWIFAGCWFVYNIVWMIISIVDPLVEHYPVHFYWAKFVAKAIAYTNFTLNPIALAYIREEIRVPIKTILSRAICSCRPLRRDRGSVRPSTSSAETDVE